MHRQQRGSGNPSNRGGMQGPSSMMRRSEEEEAAAQAFEEYVAAFQDSPAAKTAKYWVKAGTYDAGRRQEDTREKGKLYKPTPRFEIPDKKSPPPSSSSSTPSKKVGKQEKKKSNLEIFKEELKIIQEEREERHRLKKMLGLQEVIKLPPKPGDDLRATLSLELDDVKMGSIDDGDPNTTNIYLGNLPTKITERDLLDLFGRFGPLASVKVMWPRTEEEKSRNRLSGFVAFMCRRDGERALKHLAGKELFNTEVKLGWGKAVPIPPFPIFIPPAMLELTMPPPPSGLPFNAQVDASRPVSATSGQQAPLPMVPKFDSRESMEQALRSFVVKVVIPTDRTLLALIHRMVEFVAREGPMFEAMIMNREIQNPQYRFLFENQSPAHIYYRWKLFSIMQGDSTHRWRTEPFRMFKGGSIWRPPTANIFAQGMPDELIPEEEREIRKGTLSNAQRTRLERMLRNITPSRHSVAEIMIFSLEHSEAIQEICECVKESLSNPKTALPKKIARLYVISDVLYNCTRSKSQHPNAIGYKKGFKGHLPSIFQEIHYAFQTCQQSATSSKGQTSSAGECFKERVMCVFRAWEHWSIYSQEFLIKLQNIFLGLLTANSKEEEEGICAEDPETEDPQDDRNSAALSRKAQMPPPSALDLVKSLQSKENEDEDLDGVPIEEEEEDIKPPAPAIPKLFEQRLAPNASSSAKFIPSKWEAVDPEEVKAGAVTTTSKWDLFEEQQNPAGLVEEEEEDIDGRPIEEEDEIEEPSRPIFDDRDFDRDFLREVEVKCLKLQDDLERRGAGSSEVDRHVQRLRRDLLREKQKEDMKKSSKYKKRRSSSDERRRSDDRDRDDADDDGERSRHHRRHRKRTSSSRKRTRSRRSNSRGRSSSRSSRSSSASSNSSASNRRHHHRQKRHKTKSSRR